MELYCLRVKRIRGMRNFPFDRIYLVKNGTHSSLKDLFRYALIMPVEEKLKALLKLIRIDEYINMPFNRDDAASTPEEFNNAAWEDFLGSTNWVMCVPILTRFMKKNMPKYLTAEGWITKHKGEGNTPFPNMTYLQTPERNIRPVCVACPRMILHQAGECSIGDSECYESLALGLTDYFLEGLQTEKPTANVRELDVEELTRDYVQEDNA